MQTIKIHSQSEADNLPKVLNANLIIKEKVVLDIKEVKGDWSVAPRDEIDALPVSLLVVDIVAFVSSR